jgi:hypothetical protein
MTDRQSPQLATIRTPNADSLEVAKLIKARLGKRTTAPVRVAFIGANDSQRAAREVPPLARILRGGRGGEVRLKLELSFLWFAVNPPHDLSYPARVWASLIGLDDPEGRGTRRVRQAINALQDAALIRVRTQPGEPSRITLLNEGGFDVPYSLPGEVYNKTRGTGQEWQHRYIQLPDALWTNGWVATLSGASMAMLLVLFAELGQRDHSSTDLWFSPSQAQKIYGLSEDTRSKGLRELRAAGVITARKRSASRDALDFRRLRNTYRLVPEAFNEVAAVPLGVEPPQPMSPSQAQAEDFLQRFKTITQGPEGPVLSGARSTDDAEE